MRLEVLAGLSKRMGIKWLVQCLAFSDYKWPPIFPAPLQWDMQLPIRRWCLFLHSLTWAWQVICFGQWDIIKCDTSRHEEWVCWACLLLLLGICNHHGTRAGYPPAGWKTMWQETPAIPTFNLRSQKWEWGHAWPSSPNWAGSDKKNCSLNPENHEIIICWYYGRHNYNNCSLF